MQVSKCCGAFVRIEADNYRRRNVYFCESCGRPATLTRNAKLEEMADADGWDDVDEL